MYSVSIENRMTNNIIGEPLIALNDLRDQVACITVLMVSRVDQCRENNCIVTGESVCDTVVVSDFHYTKVL